ncbi:hypothetical protein DL96DRAFT_1624364 [Flagelloscypha sp. PMI_526]|nr:hypothetical protein DL96DRAFT_1624364 [Flagelloscypha sp. PMI_526]
MVTASDTTLQIAGLVHTIHLHSNFEAYNPPQALFKRNANRADIDTAILMNPHVKLLNLTIHCSMWVRLYASVAWEKFADTLVHLELQFFTSSVLRAIPQNVCCCSLKSFVLTCSAGPYRWNNAIHAPHLFDLGIEESSQKPDAYLITSIFTALKSILPSNLLSLGLHSLSHPDGFWAFDPSFLHLHAFPLLKNLQVSSASLDSDPVMLPFLLSRVGMLESLSIAATRDSYSHQSQLRDLALSSNIQELFLTYNIFWKVFSLLPFGSGHGTRIIQGCTNLLRLNIGGHISARDAFHLMVELARGESRVEQLCLSVSQLNLRLFRTVLLLLPRIADLTLADVRRQPDSDFTNYSTRMSFWAKPTESSPCTYRFVGLGKAGRRLGREVREAMTKELRKNIERVYQIESWDEQKKKAFFSSMKKALNSARGKRRLIRALRRQQGTIDG